MYKPSKNPKVEELTKSCTDRICSVGLLPYMKNEAGANTCIWCGDPLKSKHPNTRYCKDPDCMSSCYAWADPQGDNGRRVLLDRQNWKCNICQFDWEPYRKTIWYGPSSKSYSLPKERRPEVDHIIPIYKGGQSIGFENHQCICYTCHKTKSKVDNSGPRKKKLGI